MKDTTEESWESKHEVAWYKAFAKWAKKKDPEPMPEFAMNFWFPLLVSERTMAEEGLRARLVGEIEKECFMEYRGVLREKTCIVDKKQYFANLTRERLIEIIKHTK